MVIPWLRNSLHVPSMFLPCCLLMEVQERWVTSRCPRTVMRPSDCRRQPPGTCPITARSQSTPGTHTHTPSPVPREVLRLRPCNCSQTRHSLPVPHTLARSPDRSQCRYLALSLDPRTAGLVPRGSLHYRSYRASLMLVQRPQTHAWSLDSGPPRLLPSSQSLGPVLRPSPRPPPRAWSSPGPG